MVHVMTAATARQQVGHCGVRLHGGYHRGVLVHAARRLVQIMQRWKSGRGHKRGLRMPIRYGRGRRCRRVVATDQFRVRLESNLTLLTGGIRIICAATVL